MEQQFYDLAMAIKVRMGYGKGDAIPWYVGVTLAEAVRREAVCTHLTWFWRFMRKIGWRGVCLNCVYDSLDGALNAGKIHNVEWKKTVDEWFAFHGLQLGLGQNQRGMTVVQPGQGGI